MADMVMVSIDRSLKEIAPRLALGVIQAMVQVKAKDDQLWEQVSARIEELQRCLNPAAIPEQANIKALRAAYRKLGKDPARFRGSQEALLRRILRGGGLYQINSVVDINNLISLRSLHSVGSYDLTRIVGRVTFRIGQSGKSYKGIGKEVIDLTALPVFSDEIGPFGSPTSDSERTMITSNTREIMMLIIAFSGSDGLEDELKVATNLLGLYAVGSGNPANVAVVQ